MRINRFVLTLGAIFLFAAGMFVNSAMRTNASWSSFRKASTTTTPVYVAANTPVTTDISITGGLRPVVQAVRDSVVSIEMSRWVEARGGFPFFEDPFAPFFGQPRRPRERGFRQQGLGSGVVVSRDGYILTNNHVVENATDLRVIFPDRRQLRAKVTGTDPKTDVAVIKVDATGLPVITLGDSSRMQAGDFVLAIGSPFGLQFQQTITFGIVSATGRGSLGIADYGDFIQTDAAINPGNSGGALVNMRGELIGINTAILGSGTSAGVGFAIPVNMARDVMDRILKQGRVVRGYMGVRIQDLNEALAEQFRIKERQGSLVSDVDPNSPAERAGLRRGDVILEFNGQRAADSAHLRNMVAMTPPGTKATLRISRDGKEQNVTVELGELKEKGTTRPGAESDVSNTLGGIEVDEVTPSLMRRFNLPQNVSGVIVTDIDPASTAAEAGLRPGDVIQEVNRQPIRNIQDFRKAVSAAGNRRAVLLVYSQQQGASGYIVLEPRG